MSITALTYLALYVIGVLGALFVDGALGIYIYQLDYFANPAQRWWGSQLPGLRYSLIIGMMILLGYLVRARYYKENRFFASPPMKWWVALVVLAVLVWPIAVDQFSHKFFLNYFIKTLVFGFLMYKLIDTPKKFERLLWVFLLSEFYLCWVVYQTGRNDNNRVEDIGPSDGPDSNGLASAIVPCIPIAAFYLLQGRLWQKFVALVVVVFALNALVLINSRGAFVGLVAGGMYIVGVLFAAMAIPVKKKMQIVLGCFLMLGALAYVADNTFWERMATMTEVKVEGTSVSGSGTRRTEYWKAGFRMTLDRPLGAGFQGFNKLTPLYLEGYRRKALHNTYMQAMADLGFIGYGLFMALLVSVFRMVAATRKHVRGDPYKYAQCVCITASLVTILTLSIFLDRLTSELLYWVIVFLACFHNIYVLKAQDQVAETVRMPKARNFHHGVVHNSPYRRDSNQGP